VSPAANEDTPIRDIDTPNVRDTQAAVRSDLTSSPLVRSAKSVDTAKGETNRRALTKVPMLELTRYCSSCVDSHFQNADGANTRMPRKGSRIKRS
jgi:hypothetical protein